jgi:hypothetical protein
MTVFDGSYDSPAIIISVDPGQLTELAKSVAAVGLNIADNVTAINDTLSGLFLSWESGSATEAAELTQQWTNVMNEVFGTTADPSSGTLSRLMTAVETAADNYSYCEGAIEDQFNQAADELAGSSPGSAPPVNTLLPPIQETF